MSVLIEMKKNAVADKAAALSDYKAIVHRSTTPEPGDAVRLVDCMALLKISTEEVEADVAAVASVATLQRKLAVAEQNTARTDDAEKSLADAETERGEILATLARGVADPQTFVNQNTVRFLADGLADELTKFKRVQVLVLDSERILQNIDAKSARYRSEIEDLERQFPRALNLS